MTTNETKTAAADGSVERHVRPPGWVVKHPQYGTWFITRAAVAEDWKQDHRRAYPDDGPKEPCEEAINTWFAEQTSWIEVAARGEQIARPDMDAWEKFWREKMAGDPDPLTVA